MSAEVDGPDAAELRDELTALREGNKDLAATVKTKTFEYALKHAGFDPKGGEAKAIMKTWDRRVEITPDAVAQFAADEYGFTPTPAMSPAEQAAQYRAEGEQRLSMVVRGALPSREPSADDKVNAALADGDLAAAGRLNVEKLHRARRSGGEYAGTEYRGA